MVSIVGVSTTRKRRECTVGEFCFWAWTNKPKGFGF